MFLRYISALVILFALQAITRAQAVTRTFVGADGSNWSDPNNWSPAGIPIADPAQYPPESSGGDTASISGPTTITFDYDYGSTYLWLVSIGNGVTFNQSAGKLAAGGIEFAGTGYQSGGSLIGAEGVDFSGTYTLSGTGIVEAANASNINIGGIFNQTGGTLRDDNGVTVSGTLNLSGGQIIDDYFWAGAGSNTFQTGGSISGAIRA